MSQSRKRKPVSKKVPTRTKTGPSPGAKKTPIARTRKKQPVIRKKVMPASTKRQPKRNGPSFCSFTDLQKNELLIIIGKIVRLHYTDKEGLKSLAAIARIIDPCNQQYALPETKFDAIVKHSMVENPAVLRERIYVFVHSKDKETTEFYLCLAQIGSGKLTFGEARTKLEKIYHKAFETRHHMTES